MKHVLLLLSGLFPSLAIAQTFASPVTYSAGIGTTVPVSIAVGDINGDGYADVVSANYGSDGTIGVFLNRGNGTLAPVVVYTPSQTTGQFLSTMGVALGDIDKDGYLDIVAVANNGTANLAVLFNLRNGSFGPAALYATPPNAGIYGLALGDVNKDGYLDVVIADNGVGIDEVSVLLNLRNGTLGSLNRYPIGRNSGPRKVAVGDLNGDSYPDIVTADNNSSTASVLLNDTNGRFAAFTAYSTGPFSYPHAVAISDVNKDGYPDVVTVGGNETVTLLLNRSSGIFSPVTTYSAGVNSEPLGVAVGDLNGDSYPDLVTANRFAKTVGLLFSQTTGVFAAATAISLGNSLGSYPDDVVLADLNNDGKLDIITANGSANVIGVLLNTTITLATRTPLLEQVQVTVAPNPIANTASLSVAGLPAQIHKLEVVFTDVLGRNVRQLVLPVSQGTVQVLLPTADLMPGCYLLRLSALNAQNSVMGTVPACRVSVW